MNLNTTHEAFTASHTYLICHIILENVVFHSSIVWFVGLFHVSLLLMINYFESIQHQVQVHYMGWPYLAENAMEDFTSHMKDTSICQA